MKSSGCTGKSALLPVQVGVGTPAGAETMLHAVQAAARRHADGDHVLVCLDVANAFNTASREAAYKALQKNNPAMLALLEWPLGLFSGAMRSCRLLFLLEIHHLLQ